MPALAAVHAAATIARIRARILTLSTRGVYRGSPEMGAWAEVPRSGTRPRTWQDPTAERRPGSQFPHLTAAQFPHLTAAQCPHLTAAQFPHRTAAQSPHLTAAQFPHLTAAQFPHLTAAQARTGPAGMAGRRGKTPARLGSLTGMRLSNGYSRDGAAR